MQNTFEKLNLLGFKVDHYLVGLNQFISKEIIVVKHETLPEEHFTDYFEEESAVPLTNGQILFTKKPGFWYNNFVSDIIVENDEKKRTWRSSEYSVAFQEWVVRDAKGNLPNYSEYGKYCRTMDDETFSEFVDLLYAKVEKLVPNISRMNQFMGLMLNTEYSDEKLMAEIASTYTELQVQRFLESVEKCKALSLPITDYREVFNFSQN